MGETEGGLGVVCEAGGEETVETQYVASRLRLKCKV
jgi:hypothetical protein